MAALLARAAARADTRIRLRLRRRQEPVEVGADDGSGDGTATQVTAAAYRRDGGGGGSEGVATLLAAAACQHVSRPQQAPRDCRVQAPHRRARYQQQGPRDCAMCGELGRHGETGLCAACRGAAVICTVCYDQKRDFCVCAV